MDQSCERSLPNLQCLGRMGWLSQQPADFQMRMAKAGRGTRIARGQLLYAVGDSPNAIYGLVEGLLDISVPISDDEDVTIYRAGPGFWIGDSALLADTTRTITVAAATQCRLFRVSIGAVRRNLKHHPEDWICFFRLSHMNASLAVQILAEVLSLPPRERFARMLLRLEGPDGSVRATQEDLGRMAGMSRAAFRRAFAALIESGVVRTEYGGVHIVDRVALAREAEAS